MRRFLRDARGGTAIEYGLIAVLVVVVCIASIQMIGANNADNWDTVASEISEATG